MLHRFRIITSIVAIGFILRLGYFLLALGDNTIEELFRSLPDTGVYWTAAQYWLLDNINGKYWLFQVGPGYAAFIAFVYTITFDSILGVYLINILAGACYPLFLYLLVNELFDDNSMALIAASFAAISITSIVLSANILTDQLFVTLLCGGLYWYVKSYKDDLLQYQLISGLLFVLALSVRATLLWLPGLLFVYGCFKYYKAESRSATIFFTKQVSPILLVLGIIMLSLSNYMSHDVFTVGGNGVKTARLRLAALTVAEHTDNKSYADVIDQWMWQDSVYFQHQLPSFAEEYQRDRDHFFEILTAHPGWAGETFIQNVWVNLNEGMYIPEIQIPSYKSLFQSYNWFKKQWLGKILFVISLLGLALLFYRRQFATLTLVAGLYFAFVLLSGFSMWQGSRLTFPAEIVEGILIGYLLSFVVTGVKSRK